MSATYKWMALKRQAEAIRVCIHCGDPVRDPLDPFCDECERCETLLDLAADWQENGRESLPHQIGRPWEDFRREKTR
jgi:hypothetical protein